MTFVTFDQAQREIQYDAAIELHLDGIEDGFKGTKPTSHTWEYLRGYSEGCRRKAIDLREQALRLEEDAVAVERKASGEPDWLDEMFQDNDEPDLIYESMIEEF